MSWSRAAGGLLAFACAGCAAYVPPVPIHEFESGDLTAVRSFFDRQIREGDVDSSALFLNGLAQMELLQGELPRARRHFRQAGQIMGNWRTSSSEVVSAIVGAESSKTWKGDPHEKFMNAFYNGLLYWIAGEQDNARACFKKGILADGESDEGGAQTDCALLFWLAARMSAAMGLDHEAEDYAKEARRARRFAVEHGAAGAVSNAVLERPLDGNLVCILSLGLAPTKVAAGRHGSVAEVVPQSGGAASAELFLGGRSLGRAALLADLDYQATTRGGRAIEGIRRGKAVFKTVTGVGGLVMLDRAFCDLGGGGGRETKLVVGLGLLALSLLTHSAADVRHWATLPKTVHALQADVDSGEHDLRIRFRDACGRVMPHLEQTWRIEVPDDGEGVYYFRSLPVLEDGEGSS